MDSESQQEHPPPQQQQQADKLDYFCLLCYTESSSDRETFVSIRGEEGSRRNLEALIRKYFAEEVHQIEGLICGNCCHQLGNFHQFYLKIKEIQWNRKMKTAEGGERTRLTEGFQVEMTIKEEKADESYEYNHSAEVEGLNNFLNEQFGSQPDQNGNGNVQNRLLDSIVNEFQASSLGSGDLGECSSSHPFPKRIKRNIGDSWEANKSDSHPLSDTSHQELEFLEEELYEYEKPHDGRTQHPPPPISPLEELERLRKENELLKRRNHQLVVRIREVHVRNTDLLQINRELTDKLRSYDPNALTKAIPTIHDQQKVFPMVPPTMSMKHLQMKGPSSTGPLPTQPMVAFQHQPQPEVNPAKFISMSGAYTLDNGDVVVTDTVIPSRTMMDIDSIEPGDKYDLKFVSKLAVALWGHERLAVSSVTGRRSNNAGQNVAPSIQLEPEKLSFIKEKVYNRAMLENNDRVQAMARFDDSRINRLLNIKIQNAKRKKNLSFSIV